MKPVTLRPGIGDNRPSATLYYGQDVRETLRSLPEASIHTVCTSPPYWGLRDYGTATWEGGDAECDHLVRTASTINASIESSTLGGGKKTVGHSKEGFRTVCQRCGARRVDNQIGLEDNPDAFVTALVEVFREVKRVLRPDGTLWVNLGDSYAGGGRAGKNPDYQARHTMFGKEVDGSATGQFGVPMAVPEGLKPKDLVGIPWRVAFALQADGWYLRSDIVWSKPSCMPESVTDRPTKAHEYVFLFAHPDSGGKYYYDATAVAEPLSEATTTDGRYNRSGDAETPYGATGSGKAAGLGRGPRTNGSGTRNKRSVWTVNPKPYTGSHFAVWPPDLVRPMILAGCPVGGTVLDPFSGSATTGMVALQEGRNYIGTDLNPDYLKMAKARVREERPPDTVDEPDDGVLDLFGDDE